MNLRTHFRSRDGHGGVGLSAAIVAISIIGALTVVADNEGNNVRDVSGWWFALLVLPGAALLFRRVLPLCALVVVTASTMTVWASGLPDTALAATVVIYSVVVYARPDIATWAGLASAISLTLFTLLGSLTDNVPYYYVALVGLCCLTAVAFGSHSAARQRYIAEVEHSAREAEAHRAASAKSIAAEERNRIARELHDVVAHGLSVIVVQTGAAQKVFESDPQASLQAMAEVERTARASLTDMRHVLDALRAEEDGVLRPTPGINTISELVEQFEASDLAVELRIDPDLQTTNGALNTTAYRIVQESLTNVLKHAGPTAAAKVEVRRDDHSLAIVVSDNGRGAAADQSDSGYGLLGMRERVELFGGTLQAGARQGGGFEVNASLPLQATVS